MGAATFHTGVSMRLAALVLAVLSPLAFAARADAVYIAREGDQIVVRPDDDELLKDVEVTVQGGSFTIAKHYTVDDIGTPHAGPGCDASGAPRCAIAGARALRVELGEGDQQALVTDSPIPVTIDGGTGRDRPEVRNAPSVTILGGTGDDIIKASARGPIAVDGGEGDDTVDVTGGSVTGGAGDDTIRGATTADGGAGDDTIRGATTASGGAGDDVL